MFLTFVVTFIIHRSQSELIPANSIECNISEHVVASVLPTDNTLRAVLFCGFYL